MAIKIPIVIGKNRLRGNSVGPMVYDPFGFYNLDLLKKTLATEARKQGVEPTQEWLTKSVSQTLKIYEDAYNEWMKDKGDTQGFIYEAALNPELSILIGDPVALDKINEIGWEERDAERLAKEATTPSM